MNAVVTEHVPSDAGELPRREPSGEEFVVPTPIPAHGRVVVQAIVACIQPGIDPQTINAGCAWPLTEDAMSYARPGTVAGPEWTGIDAGWTGHGARFLVIVNYGAKRRAVAPATAEAAADARLVIEVKLHPDDKGAAIVAPGRAVMLAVADSAAVRVRCANGECRFTCGVFPQ